MWDPMEWFIFRTCTSGILAITIWLSSVFSADPPVFTRGANAAPAPAPKPRASTSYAGSGTADPSIQAQAEAILAKEAEEANRAAETARQWDRDEQERAEQMVAHQKWEKSVAFVSLNSSLAGLELPVLENAIGCLVRPNLTRNSHGFTTTCIINGTVN